MFEYDMRMISAMMAMLFLVLLFEAEMRMQKQRDGGDSRIAMLVVHVYPSLGFKALCFPESGRKLFI